MVSLLICFQEFVLYAGCSILGLTKTFSAGKTFYFIITIIVGIDILRFKNNYLRIPRKDLYVLMGVICFICAYWTTMLRYGFASEIYIDNFPQIILKSIIPLLSGYYLTKRERCDVDNIIRFLPAFAIFFTLGGLIAAFFSSGQWSAGGYIDDDSGFRYQNVSYALAYSFGMVFFYLLNNKNTKKDNKYFTIVLWCMLPLQVFGILISGGKGGFVALVVLFVFNIVIYFYCHNLSKKVFKRIVAFVSVATVIVVIIIRKAMESKLSTSAFFRIVRLLTMGDDTGRSRWFEMSLESSKEAIVIGHGIGSVPYEIYPYSHNYFLDVLLENGLIGLVLVIAFFVWMAHRFWRLFKKDASYAVIIMLFLCGFTRAMFSGYYLSPTPIYWGIGIALGSRRLLKSTTSKVSIREEGKNADYK